MRHRRAQLVLQRFPIVRCFDVTYEGGAEDLLAHPNRLQGNITSGEHESRGSALQSICRAIHMEGVGLVGAVP